MLKRYLYSMACLSLTAIASSAEPPSASVRPARVAASNVPVASMIDQDAIDRRFPNPLITASSPALWLDDVAHAQANAEPISQVTMLQLSSPQGQAGFSGAPSVDPRSFAGPFSTQRGGIDVGVDFNSAPEFRDGLLIFGRNVAMKVGGYAKADFIYDFDPIDSTDSFDTTSIPVGAADRTNFRAHARQSRLSFDTRWKADGRVVQIFVESDFFSSNDQFRLRHAYGEVGSLLVGQTWTTFTDVTAVPATLDFEGSVSNVNRRQAQARWTQPILGDAIKLALSIEDTQFIVISPPTIPGDARSPFPDLVAQLRLEQDWGKFQIAGLFRRGGFQPTGAEVEAGNAWGMNFTGTVLVLDTTKAYYQVLFGEGIGSYRGLPDAAPVTATTEKLLPLFGWMVGVTHEWNDRLSSNFTYAASHLDNTPLQAADDLSATTYLAANLIWSALERVQVGVEYLYGTRENVDQAFADAHRIQSAFIFYLP